VCSSQSTTIQSSNHIDNDDTSSLAERRRSSLRTMRQCLSLPHPTSGSTLRMLIESRVRLTTRSGCRPRDKMTSDRADFFLEVVRDVSCELDLTSLTRKVLANLSALVSAQYASIYMLDGSCTWSGLHGRRPRLVSRSYDARDGLGDDERYSQITDDEPTLTAPWGHGLAAISSRHLNNY